MWNGDFEYVRCQGWGIARRRCTFESFAPLCGFLNGARWIDRLFGQIDMSNIIDQAQKIVAANGFSGGAPHLP